VINSARVISHPFSPFHIILGCNGIMPNQLEPDFDFEWDFGFPQLLKAPVNSK
jgi:hypothetical protein